MNRCTDENLGKLLHQYELGMLGDKDREAFEIHLYECDKCLADVQELWEQSRLLRQDPEARRIIDAAVKRAAGDRDSTTNDEEPLRRRWWRSFMPVSVAAAAVLALLILRPWQIDIRPTDDVVASAPKLVVMPFENIQDPDDQKHLGEVIANLLITDLSESNFLQVISPERLFDIRKLIRNEGKASDSGDLIAIIAEHAQARWVLQGSIFRDQQATAITSRLVEYPGLKVLATQKVTGLAGEPVFSLIDRLTIKVKSDLSLPRAAFEEVDPKVADITTHFPEAYHRFLEGVDYNQKLYFPEAAQAFESCVAIDSSYAMAYYYLASLKDSELIKQAMEYIDRASHKDRYYIRSRAAQYSGDEAGHKNLLEELLERYPNEKEALVGLGVSAHGEGRYKEAISRFTAAVEIDPLHKSAYNMLSYSYDAIGDLEKAVEAINRYISIAPNEANPYDSRGDLFARNGLIEEAIESYQIALEKKPDFHVSKENLGHMYVFQNKYEEATRLYQDLVDINSEQPYISRYDLDIAFIPVRLGKFDEALRIIDEVIDLYQAKAKENNSYEPTITHFLKFWIHLEKNELNEALKDAEHCVRLSDLISPDNLIHYRWTLAYPLALTGQHQRADSIVDAVYEYYQQNPSKPIAYYWAKGMVALARHDGETSVSMMKEGVEGYTADTKFMGLARLGHVYVDAGMYEEAIRTLEPTTRVLGYQRLIDGVYGVKVHYYLGMAYEGIGDYTLAVEQYATFLELWKDADPGLLSVIDARDRLTRLESAP